MASTLGMFLAIVLALFVLDFFRFIFYEFPKKQQLIAGIGQTQSLEERVISVYNQWETDWKHDNYVKSCEEKACRTKDELELFLRKFTRTRIEPWDPPLILEGKSRFYRAHFLNGYASKKIVEMRLGKKWEDVYG